MKNSAKSAMHKTLLCILDLIQSWTWVNNNYKSSGRTPNWLGGVLTLLAIDTKRNLMLCVEKLSFETLNPNFPMSSTSIQILNIAS